jgi:hypothetical protein
MRWGFIAGHIGEVIEEDYFLAGHKIAFYLGQIGLTGRSRCCGRVLGLDANLPL